MLSYIKEIDKKIINHVTKWQKPLFSRFLLPFTKLGSLGFIWILISLPLFLNENSRKAGFRIIMAVLITGFLGEVFIKNIAKRKRPSKYIENQDMLIKKPITYSFPSGHTSSSVACAIIIASFYPQATIPVSFLAFLVSFSRLYFKVHYLSDILAGAFLGLVCAIFIVNSFPGPGTAADTDGCTHRPAGSVRRGSPAR